MAPRIKDPFLSLAPDRIASLDASDAENLFSVWTVFSKCAENLENGRRLENLSWRLWNRDRSYSVTEPELSSSVDSVASLPEPVRCREHSKSDTAERFHRVIESISCDDLDWKKLQASQKRITVKPSSTATLVTQIPPPPTVNNTPAILGQTGDSGAKQQPQPQLPTSNGESFEKGSMDSFYASENEDDDEDDEDEEDDRGRLARVTPSTTSIVRGFSPSAISVHSVRSELFMKPQRSQPHMFEGSGNNNMSVPNPAFTARGAPRSAATTSMAVDRQKKMFFIESSPSESDGFGESISPAASGAMTANHMHHNSMSSSLRSSFTAKAEAPAAAKTAALSKSARKRASFKDEVTTIPSPEEEEDDENDDGDENDDDLEASDEDDISESAIDDADSDWDSVEDEGPSSFDESSFFVRERPLPSIPSRRSLLSSLLGGDDERQSHLLSTRSSPALTLNNHQQLKMQRRATMLSGISNSTTAEASDMRAAAAAAVMGNESAATSGSSVESSDAVTARNSPTAKSSSGSSSAVPVPATPTRSAQSMTNGIAVAMPALSPRSTRRNMLASELSESLRRNLLWERQQKTAATTAAAALKRRHTSHDVTQLTSYPEPIQALPAAESTTAVPMASQGASGVALAGSFDDKEFDHTEFGYHARGW
ncbi:uncharacterized protein V2V93DRAFT_376060 [Kockiozyma suomiensis]|uniref:uncharacterized protein n=1 Tax=Kockiozyma suomiensis TaxID=1337062 RepID=UPI0033442EF6